MASWLTNIIEMLPNWTKNQLFMKYSILEFPYRSVISAKICEIKRPNICWISVLPFPQQWNARRKPSWTKLKSLARLPSSQILGKSCAEGGGNIFWANLTQSHKWNNLFAINLSLRLLLIRCWVFVRSGGGRKLTFGKNFFPAHMDNEDFYFRHSNKRSDGDYPENAKFKMNCPARKCLWITDGNCR